MDHLARIQLGDKQKLETKKQRLQSCGFKVVGWSGMKVWPVDKISRSQITHSTRGFMNHVSRRSLIHSINSHEICNSPNHSVWSIACIAKRQFLTNCLLAKLAFFAGPLWSHYIISGYHNLLVSSPEEPSCIKVGTILFGETLRRKTDTHTHNCPCDSVRPKAIMLCGAMAFYRHLFSGDCLCRTCASIYMQSH